MKVPLQWLNAAKRYKTFLFSLILVERNGFQNIFFISYLKFSYWKLYTFINIDRVDNAIRIFVNVLEFTIYKILQCNHLKSFNRRICNRILHNFISSSTILMEKRNNIVRSIKIFIYNNIVWTYHQYNRNWVFQSNFSICRKRVERRIEIGREKNKRKST